MSGFSYLSSVWGDEHDGLGSTAAVSTPIGTATAPTAPTGTAAPHHTMLAPTPVVPTMNQQQGHMDYGEDTAFAMMRQPAPAPPLPTNKPSKDDLSKIHHQQMMNLLTTHNKYIYEEIHASKDSQKKLQKSVENQSYILYALLGVNVLVVILLIVFYFKINSK